MRLKDSGVKYIIPKKIAELTAAQEARFGEFVTKWIGIGLSTQPADRPRAETAIRGLYSLTKLKEPKIIWLPCPISAALSAVCYAAIIKKRLVKDAKPGSAVDSAVYSAVGSAVYSAVDSAVYSAVGSAVDSAVYSAVYSAVGSAVYSAVDSAVYSAGRSFFGGSLWCSYQAWADYFDEVCGIAIDRHYLDASESCGFYWTLDSVCFASERPFQINRDVQGRLHSETGQSIGYPSGWGLWHIHGVQVPQFVVERPDAITAPVIEAEKNAEVRRVMIERFGEDRYIEESGMLPVAKDERFGDLYVQQLEAGRPIAKLRVTNRSPEPDGSYRKYMLPINPALYNGDAGRIPQAASASTWRTEPAGKELFFPNWKDYNPAFES